MTDDLKICERLIDRIPLDDDDREAFERLFRDHPALISRVEQLEARDKISNEPWPNSEGGACPLCKFTCSRSVYPDRVEIECNDCTFTCLEEDMNNRVEQLEKGVASRHDWEPIASAPDDGTQILLSDGWNTSLGFWDRDEESEGGQCWRTFPDLERVEPLPTHWMKIPRYYTK